MSLDLRIPHLRRGALAVWGRNVRVWRRLLAPSLLINFGEPFIYLLGLGFGLGLYIGTMADMPYLTFLASGIVCASAMNTASFEGMYSVYTRMIPQKTYDAMLATPLDVDDILAGEMMWCGTKSVISGTMILAVAALLGAVTDPGALLVIPVLFLLGLCFAGPAIIMSAVAPGYDFFNYYMTLFITPMFIFSGVFYPVSALPDALQLLVNVLPLAHAVALVRPLVAAQPMADAAAHVGVLLAYTVVGYYLAVVFVRRRLVV